MIQLKHAKIEWTDYGCLTTFADGKTIASIPHMRDYHYHVIAHRLGYEDDLMAYTREHDFAHLFMCEKLNGLPSTVLWSLAHGEKVSPHTAVYEEALAQLLQRYMRGNEQPIIADMPWPELRAEALALLG